MDSFLKQHIADINPTDSDNNWPSNILKLKDSQLAGWELARKNYTLLDKVEIRIVKVNKMPITLQYNPERIRSTAAKTDKKSIASRACFLCPDKLPVEQKGYYLLDKYLLLINPFPIFNQHLTISSTQHEPQLIKNRINDLLQLTEKLDRYTVFYNGPECGASAPDHFHFQAIPVNSFPLQQNNHLFSVERKQINDHELQINNNGFMRFFKIIGKNRVTIKSLITQIMDELPPRAVGEAMVNIISSYKDGKFEVIIFPRLKHKPDCFYEAGDKQIVVGAASVEMGGICVLPRKEDFDKTNGNDLFNIYNEVILPPNEMLEIFKKLA